MSAADTGCVSASGTFGDAALSGGFDALVDCLPGLVVVGAVSWPVDVVVIGWVCRGVSIVSELAVSEGGAQRFVGFEACSLGDGGLVDPVPGDGLGEDVDCGFVLVGDDVGVVGVPASG